MALSAFTAVVGTIPHIDLGLFNKKNHVISTKEAVFWSAVWVAFAVLFGALFIAFGSYLMQFEWVIITFGLFLVFTGVKMPFSTTQEIEPEKNFLVRIVKRFIPVHDEIEGKRFFRKENGKWHATRLFVALIFLEFTDVLFAVDSVPAIFAITKEPLIVFASNILAIRGLWSMYFMLDGATDKFYLLKYGLSAILIFVGLKMTVLNHFWGGKFPISYSLLFVGSAVAVSVVASLVFPKSPETCFFRKLRQLFRSKLIMPILQHAKLQVTYEFSICYR